MNTIPHTSWLFPEEHPEVVSRLLEDKLLKFDNTRSLPLKSGGTTDVYINLRDARDRPAAIRFITDLFEIPLRRLNVSRFIEVPDSVSCFAGPLSIATNIPYVTIREQVKTGRVTDAKVIGHTTRGESICILDDVITNGASKVAAYEVCRSRGLLNKALVVLVDRQQGWQKYFADQDITIPVWAGMTLHDVRRQLIQGLGIMQRCDPKIEKANPIIVALDGKDWEQILPLIDPLRTTGCILKVNDLLFDQGISHLLPDLSVYGRIMADLKGHDISNTIGNVCKRLRPHNPWAVTVHGSGGMKMIAEAVKTLEGTSTKVLAVTVLTSIDPKTCEEIYTRLPREQVRALAAIAVRGGAHGFVCSPQEASELSSLYPNKLIVTPGIRSAGVQADDQERIGTPRGAMDNGSNHLVMGRQILGASDPVAEVKRIITEELQLPA